MFDEAKICKFEISIVLYQHIFWLKISENHILRVQILDTSNDLRKIKLSFGAVEFSKLCDHFH